MGFVSEEHVAGNEDILYPKWTKAHYKGGEKEYERLERAEKICRDAALRSASWGMFQIMGVNHESCGCKSIAEFLDIMYSGEYGQLELFLDFVKTNGLDRYLREKNWKEFARRYNGPGYEQNQYDVKLRNAYEKFCKG